MFVCYLNSCCYSLFKCIEGQNKLVLGSSFLQNYITTFDYENKTISIRTRFSNQNGDIILNLTEYDKKIEKNDFRNNHYLIKPILNILIFGVSITMLFIFCVKKKMYNTT